MTQHYEAPTFSFRRVPLPAPCRLPPLGSCTDVPKGIHLHNQVRSWSGRGQWQVAAKMSSEESSSYCSDSDDDDYDGGGGGRRLDIPHSVLTEVQDYAQAYAPLDADVLGQDSSGDDDEDFLLDATFSGKKGGRGGTCSPQAIAPRLACPRPAYSCVCVQAERGGEARETSYMFFDFRHGPEQWPEVCNATRLRWPHAAEARPGGGRMGRPCACADRRASTHMCRMRVYGGLTDSRTFVGEMRAVRAFLPQPACVGRDGHAR